MRVRFAVLLATLALTAATAVPASADPINSPIPTLAGPAIDFEGFGEGTLVNNQYGGVYFGQTDGGTPMIDDLPYLFAYKSASGLGVLTGSTTGGAPYPTVAGLTATFAMPQRAVEFFLSDTVPLGSYTINAYGAGDVLLESFVLPLAASYGSYVGFSRGAADIFMFDVDSSVENDAFGFDDLRSDAGAPVPEPGSMILLGTGLVGLSRAWRKRRR
jgi:hypothetical protein